MKTRKKAGLIISLVILGATIGNLIRTHALDNIRAVDALTLMAAGMALGVLIANVVWLLRNKQ